MKAVDVSIICPVFNKENYISDTIRSVLTQTVSNWELILVDDGSTDRSMQIAQQIAHNNLRVRFLYRSDFCSDKKGANVCRNIGIEKAKGKYIIFLDADDVLLPFCIEQRLSIVRKTPGFNLYIFNVAYSISKDLKPFDKLAPSELELRKVYSSKDLRLYFLEKFLSFDLPWHTSGPLWTLETLKSNGGFDESFQRLQDPELHSRILLNEQIKVNYQMGNTPYDVVHITADDRLVWNSAEFYKKRIHAIKMYLQKLIPLAQAKLTASELKWFQGYLILAETLTYRYLRDNPVGKIEETQIRRALKELFKDKYVKTIISTRLVVLLFLFHTVSFSSFLRKMKLPGAVLLFAKKTI